MLRIGSPINFDYFLTRASFFRQKNWLYPKIKPPKPSLTKLSLSKSVIHWCLIIRPGPITRPPSVIHYRAILVIGSNHYRAKPNLSIRARKRSDNELYSNQQFGLITSKVKCILFLLNIFQQFYHFWSCLVLLLFYVIM